ncbi:MAG: hypothetical protein P8184_01560 [Calditrichia bacterium]
MSKRTRKLHKIARRLTTHQLRRLREKDVSFGFDDLFTSTPQQCASPYFLGYYSPAGIEYALEKYGLYEELRRRGYDDFKLIINTEDPYKQRIALYFEKKQPDHLLGELVVKRKHVTVYPPFPTRIHGRTFEGIAVEWLCMQNPKGAFTSEKPRLPGQKYPGLGMGVMVMEMLIIMCGRLRTAGLLNIPEHFHNAQMYSSHFFYLDPLYEAKRVAMERDLLFGLTLSQVSWAVELDCVLENGKPFKWHNAEQIIPLDRGLKDYFKSKAYKQYVKETAKEFSYSLDEDKWSRKRDAEKDDNIC